MVLIRLAAVSTLETDGAREEPAMVLMTLVWGKQRKGAGGLSFDNSAAGAKGFAHNK